MLWHKSSDIFLIFSNLANILGKKYIFDQKSQNYDIFSPWKNSMKHACDPHKLYVFFHIFHM